MDNEDKLDWIYKGANSLVDREDYLLGRKVDKVLEQLNEDEKEKKFVLPTPKNHVEHECIPPSIRDFNKIIQAEQVDLSAKLQEDPLVAIKKREEEARRKFLQNPVQLRKLQDALRQQENEKKNKKSKFSDSDLDKKIKRKLKLLKNSSSHLGLNKKEKKKANEDALNTILTHKFNALKDKLSEDDLKDILEGKINESSDDSADDTKIRASYDSSENESDNHSKRERSGSSTKHNEKYKRYQKDNYSQVTYKNTRKKNLYREVSYSRGASKSSEFKQKYEIQSYRYNDMQKRHQEESSEISSRELRSDMRNSQKSYKINDSDSDDRQTRKKPDKNESDHDLNEKIMAKLRMLRGEAEKTMTKQNDANYNYPSFSSDENSKDRYTPKRNMFPEKPNYLSNRSEGNICSSPESTSKHPYNSDDEEVLPVKKFGLVTSGGKRITLKGTKDNNIQIKSDRKKDVPVKFERKQIKRLTEDEKEKLRKEMMQDAKVRDKEREINIKRYREQNKKEEESTNRKYNDDFVRSELLKAAKHSSIEDRIKSNLNSIQRSSKHMDSNFAKR